MEKYVYKLTNLINDKIYIGQTNNIDRRMQEHKHDKRNNKPIHAAIVKYGWENFMLDILYYGEDYNEEEKKWIKFYDSQNKDKGYNIVKGGQDSSGESNPAAVLTQEQVDNVIKLLLNTNKSTREISKETGVSIRNIEHINVGDSWHDKKYKYPIRKNNRLSDDIVNKIIDLLQNTNYSYEEIYVIVNVPKNIIGNINLGINYKKNTLTYPIRDVNKDKKEMVKKAIDLLSNTNLNYKEIAEITNFSIGVISKINRGVSWKQETIKYPIRNNK